jgi:hypothetical protein
MRDLQACASVSPGKSRISCGPQLGVHGASEAVANAGSVDALRQARVSVMCEAPPVRLTMRPDQERQFGWEVRCFSWAATEHASTRACWASASCATASAARNRPRASVELGLVAPFDPRSLASCGGRFSASSGIGSARLAAWLRPARPRPGIAAVAVARSDRMA